MIYWYGDAPDEMVYNSNAWTMRYTKWRGPEDHNQIIEWLQNAATGNIVYRHARRNIDYKTLELRIESLDDVVMWDLSRP